jgi:hypothetical protein
VPQGIWEPESTLVGGCKNRLIMSHKLNVGVSVNVLQWYWRDVIISALGTLNKSKARCHRWTSAKICYSPLCHHRNRELSLNVPEGDEIIVLPGVPQVSLYQVPYCTWITVEKVCSIVPLVE